MIEIRRSLAAAAAVLVLGSSGAVRAAEVSFILNWVAGGDHAPIRSTAPRWPRLGTAPCSSPRRGGCWLRALTRRP